jgi:hypothetical protein
LFFILGYSEEGLQVLKTFLNSKHDEIYDPVLLAQMVLSPLNSIVDDVLIPLAEHECDYSKSKKREVKAKLNILFRFDIMCRMLGVLGEFGMTPDFEKQKFVKKLIKNTAFGKSSGTNRLVHVTGFTAAFLLTLPEFFMQWRDQKDGDESNEKQYKVLEFLGQQCQWPSFSNANLQRKTSSGSMLSNARSLPPYSFLPKEVFDLTKVFKDCLDGNTEWETYSLCEEPKMIESSPRKRPAEATEDPTEEQPSAKQTKRLLAEKRKEEQKEESAEESSAAAEESSGEEKRRADAGEEEEVGIVAGDDGSESEEDNGSESEEDNDAKSEASPPVPRKKTRAGSASGQETYPNPNPLLGHPYYGADMTEFIRNLSESIDNEEMLYPNQTIGLRRLSHEENICMVFKKEHCLRRAQAKKKESI